MLFLTYSCKYIQIKTRYECIVFNSEVFLFPESSVGKGDLYLPAMKETLVQFLGWEDPLEEEMKTRSSILAWEIPWTEEPGGVTVPGATQSWTQLSD